MVTLALRADEKTSMREDAGLNARQRMAKDARDLRNLFGRECNETAPKSINHAKPYGQLAGKGSWEGHKKAATDIKSGLTQDILEFDQRGCNKHYKIPASIRRIASLEIPSSPDR